MAKIVILNGSPRKNGKTASLVKAFVEGAESVGNEVKELYLQGMNIGGCLACEESRRQKNLRGAFCVNCNTGVFKPGYTVRRSDGFIVLEGECAICGSPMVKFCV